MVKKKYIVFILIITIFISSCGNNPPEFKQIKKQINFIYSQDKDTVEAEICLMIVIEDEDSEYDEDLEFIYIINDKQSVYWLVEKNEWVRRDEQGRKWIGYEHLKNVNGDIPYSGSYRVLIVDKAGERDETTFFIPAIKELPKKKDFPMIKKTENKNKIEIQSKNENNVITFFDKDNNVIEVLSATPGFLDLDKFLDNTAKSNCRYITIATYSNTFGSGLITEGFSLD